MNIFPKKGIVEARSSSRPTKGAICKKIPTRRPSETMASASDGLAATLSSLPDLSLNPFASSSERKFHLQLLLDNKEKQLQQAGALGQRILAQQIELEEKIRQLHDFDVERGDDEDLDSDARERYRELADTVKAWDAENAQLSSAFGSEVLILSRSPSPSHFFPSIVAFARNVHPSLFSLLCHSSSTAFLLCF